jgi:hypothetical protein
VKKNGFLNHVRRDLKQFAASIINNMSDEQFEAWMVLNDRMAESMHCVGLSNHALLVCERG